MEPSGSRAQKGPHHPESLTPSLHINLSVTPVGSTFSCRCQRGKKKKKGGEKKNKNGCPPLPGRSGERSNPASLCHFGSSRSVIIAHLPRRRPPPPLSRPIWRRVIRPHFCRRSLTGRLTAAPPVLRFPANCVPVQRCANIPPAICHRARLEGFCQIRRARCQNYSRTSLLPSPPLSRFWPLIFALSVRRSCFVPPWRPQRPPRLTPVRCGVKQLPACSGLMIKYVSVFDHIIRSHVKLANRKSRTLK